MPDPQMSPTVINASFARQVRCNLLYDQFRRQLGTSRVSVMVQGCRVNGEVYTDCPVIQVPSVEKFLNDVCPQGYNYYKVSADYTAGRLLPDELMTRADFLMEILEIWGTMRTRLSPHLGATIGSDLDLVMKFTRNVYAVSELTDLNNLYMETDHENEVASG